MDDSGTGVQPGFFVFQRTFTISRQRLILGEGDDERRVIEAMVKFLGRTDVQVWRTGGKDGLRPFLKGLVPSEGFHGLESLAILRDADESPKSAFHSVRDALRANGLAVPSAPEKFAGVHPRVGVFIVPGKNRKGILEDLFRAAAQSDAKAACVNEYLRCVRRSDRRCRRSSLGSKAWLHSWLAAGRKPGLRIGEAAEADFWDWRDGAFGSLLEFIGKV